MRRAFRIWLAVGWIALAIYLLVDVLGDSSVLGGSPIARTVLVSRCYV
jgi:hypothetical protein